MKETIHNPDLWLELELRCWKNPHPHWSHLEVEHLPILCSSENPIINNLIKNGYSVHPTVTSCFLGFPTREYSLSGHFISQVRHEFQINFGDQDGFLRFRFEALTHVYLSLFRIEYEKQGNGLGRKYFKPVTDAMFRAGVISMHGKVSESYYPSKRPMNRERLTAFYVREAAFEASDDGGIQKFSPFLDNSNCPPNHFPYNQEMSTFKTLESARAS